jgi:hypothetical protein
VILSKGLYIVKALNENDEVQMMKFIKKIMFGLICEKLSLKGSFFYKKNCSINEAVSQ